MTVYAGIGSSKTVQSYAFIFYIFRIFRLFFLIHFIRLSKSYAYTLHLIAALLANSLSFSLLFSHMLHIPTNVHAFHSHMQHTHIHTNKHTHTFTQLRVHIYIHTHSRLHTYTVPYIHIHILNTIDLHLLVHTHIHTFLHTYQHTYILCTEWRLVDGVISWILGFTDVPDVNR